MGGERVADLEAAVAQWERRAGTDDPETLEARVRLALAYRERGRDEAAVAELEQVVALGDEALGAGHPGMLAARHELALSYFHMSIWQHNPHGCRTRSPAMELAADGRLGALGPAHPDTLASWESLALLYSRSGRRDDRGRMLRPTGGRGLGAGRGGKGTPGGRPMSRALESCRDAGSPPRTSASGEPDDRRVIHERVIGSWGRLADARSRRLGPVHPDTVDAREHHAYCHRLAGRGTDEVALVEQIAADHERLLGPGDPRTLRALARLAFRYGEGAHDTPAAIALGERIIGDAHDALGPEDEAMRALRAMLIVSYAQTGRTSDAHAIRARFPAPGEDE